jgi:chromosome segregation ATPase
MNILKSLFVAGAIAGALVLDGCQTTQGSARADTTAMHMDDLRTSIQDLDTKMQAAVTSLSSVVETGAQDPKPAFAQYQKNVAATDSALARCEKTLKAMQTECQTYFAEWQQQAATMTDPSLRAKAEERRTKLSKAIDGVTKAMDEARGGITPFMMSIKDVQTYLSNDLTPAGIKSIKDKSGKLTKDARSISKSLDEVVEALEKGAPEFRTATPPPPETKAKS